MLSTGNKKGPTRAGFGIRSRLMVFFFLFSICPMLCFGFLVQTMVRQYITSNLQKNMATLINLRTRDVERYFNDMKTEIQHQAERPSNRLFLESLYTTLERSRLNPSEFFQGKDWSSHDREIRELRYIMDSGEYSNVYLADPKGNILYALGDQEYMGVNLFSGQIKDMKLSGACRLSLKSDEPVVSDYEPFWNEKKNIIVGHMVAPVRSMVDNRLIGLIVMQFGIEPLNRAVRAHMVLGQTYENYLIGEDGYLRTDSGKRYERHAVFSKADPGILNMRHDAILTPGAHPLFAYHGGDSIQRVGMRAPVNFGKLQYEIIAEMEWSEAFMIMEKIRHLLIVLTVIVSVLSMVISYFASERIIWPLKALTDWAENVATGDLSLIDIRTADDEIGHFNQSFRQMVLYLKDVARKAVSISAGDYSDTVEPRSPYDEFGAALKRTSETLKDASKAMMDVADGHFDVSIPVKGPNDLLAMSVNSMVDKIRKAKEDNEYEASLKTLQEELNILMRGDPVLQDLTENILNFLCGIFNASAGVLYIHDEDEDALRFYSGYALPPGSTIPVIIRKDEGLVGQVLREGNMIIIDHCPDGYMKAHASSADLTLAMIIVYPFIREGQIEGIIEMGSTGVFKERDIAFLEHVSGNIGIALSSARSQLKMKALLEKTVKQARDLTIKQDELNTMNRELQETFARLRQQEIELKQTNRDLIEKTEKLEISSRYKSEFLANMSHELRTPLNSILLISRLLSENKTGNLGVREIEFAKTVQSAGMDLLSLIDDILDLSKIEAGRFEIIPDLAKTAYLRDKIVMNFRDICMEKGIGLITEIKPDVPETVYIDLKRMDQVIKNLVSNAVKFTESGYIMMVISIPDSLPESLQEHHSPDDCLKITVKDTGTGIPIDKREVVFQAFQQVDGTISRQYGGTGLGLSISRELVRLMGGDIVLDSTEGLGSTFDVFIPDVLKQPVDNEEHVLIKQTPDMDSSVPVSSNHSPIGCDENENTPATVRCDFNGRKILIADNDMRNVYSLISIIGDRNPDILVARSGQECLDIIAHHSSIDLVVMDTMIPGVDRIRNTEKTEILKRLEYLPVILIVPDQTGSDVEALHIQCLSKYLTKPVDTNLLVSVMNEMLGENP